MKIFRIEFLILVLIFVAAILRPLPKANLENAEIVKSRLLDFVASTGENDIAFRLENGDHKYYINRGLERGIDIESLKYEMLDQEIEVFYIKHFTPIDPQQKSRHVSRIKIDGSIIYDEISPK